MPTYTTAGTPRDGERFLAAGVLRERGQDAVEYALIVILVALAITASMLMLARTMDGSYNNASACVGGTVVAGASRAGNPSSPARGKGKGQSRGSAATACP